MPTVTIDDEAKKAACFIQNLVSEMMDFDKCAPRCAEERLLRSCVMMMKSEICEVSMRKGVRTHWELLK